jgi:hypothetical protein
MNKTRIRYFEQEDVLHLVITEEPETVAWNSAPASLLNSMPKMS